MDAINIQCNNNSFVISRRVIVKMVYLMIYLCIYAINFKRLNAYFKKKADDAEEQEEQEELRRILPEEEEPLPSSNEVVEGEDMETLHVYEFEGTGEQLRRLRAYNKKNDEETDEEYTNRIWSMAYQEDEEESKQKTLSSNAVVNEAPVANEVVLSKAEPLEKDVSAWHTIEDGKCRYKGEWKNGLPNGKGIKHFYKTDSYIDGNFVDGYADGFGKQTFEQTWEKTQPYYEGEFKRNNYNGKGEYHYGDGDYYKGMWKDGKYNGQGAAYSKRLDRTWVGEYENDVKGEGNWVKGEI